MIRSLMQDLDPYWPKITTVCGAVAGGAAAALSAVGDFAMQVLGVPLPVVTGAAFAAGFARSCLPPVGFCRAALMTCVWTVLGCSGAPLVQSILKVGAFGMQADLPPSALAGLAGLIASAPWWWQWVWPAVQRRLGLAKEGSGNV
jgi:hypothetical protein